MHEWALAEAIITAVKQLVEKEKLQDLREVTIKLGALQQVEEDILRFAISQLNLAAFKNAQFHIEKAKTVLKCRACGNTWLFSRKKLDKDIAEAIHFVPEVAHAYIKCPKCGSPDFEISKGRGVWIENIRGVR